MKNIPELSLLINNDVYKYKFDFEVIMEKEVCANIILYNLLPETNLKNTNVEIFHKDFSIFKGIITSYNLENGKSQVVLNLEAKLEASFLSNLKFLSKNEVISNVIPCNLNTNITALKSAQLKGNNLEKMETIKDSFNLPYFSILKDRVNFVDFNSQAKQIEDILSVKIDKTENNLICIKINTNFNGNLNVGDIVSYNKNLYAIETIIYSFINKNIFTQEIYAINNQLHNIRYLN